MLIPALEISPRSRVARRLYKAWRHGVRMDPPKEFRPLLAIKDRGRGLIYMLVETELFRFEVTGGADWRNPACTLDVKYDEIYHMLNFTKHTFTYVSVRPALVGARTGATA